MVINSADAIYLIKICKSNFHSCNSLTIPVRFFFHHKIANQKKNNQRTCVADFVCVCFTTNSSFAFHKFIFHMIWPFWLKLKNHKFPLLTEKWNHLDDGLVASFFSLHFKMPWFLMFARSFCLPSRSLVRLGQFNFCARKSSASNWKYRTYFVMNEHWTRLCCSMHYLYATFFTQQRILLFIFVQVPLFTLNFNQFNFFNCQWTNFKQSTIFTCSFW